MKGPDGLPIYLGRGIYGPRVGQSGFVYMPNGKIMTDLKENPMKVGFCDDGRVRVGRFGDLRAPDRSSLTDKKLNRVFVSENPYVGFHGYVYKPDGYLYLQPSTKTPMKAKLNKNKRPIIDDNGSLMGVDGLPLKDESGNNLILGTGPIVFKGLIMLPVGRPLTGPDFKVIRPGYNKRWFSNG